MIKALILGQIPYNYFLLVTLCLGLGQNLRPYLLGMMVVAAKENAEHMIRLPKVISTYIFKTRYAQLLIIIYRLWRVL